MISGFVADTVKTKARQTSTVTSIILASPCGDSETTLLVDYGNDCVFSLLWDFPLAPNEGGKLVELQQDGPVLLELEF